MFSYKYAIHNSYISYRFYILEKTESLEKKTLPNI